MDICYHLESSSEPGKPLDTICMVKSTTTANRVASGIVNALRTTADRKGIALALSRPHGTYARGEIENFTGTPEVDFHESLHQDLDEVWPGADRSFSEGYAYAFQDKKFGDAPIMMARMDFAKEFPRTYISYVGDHDTDLGPMLKKSMLRKEPGHRWPQFLNAGENFRYYDLFFSVDSSETVLEAGVIGRQDGVVAALEFLTEKVGRYESRIMQAQQLPIWDCSIFDEDAVAITLEHEHLLLQLASTNQSVAQMFCRIIERYERRLREIGTIDLEYKEGFHPTQFDRAITKVRSLFV